MAKRLDDIGRKLSEEQVISKILSGLPYEFMHILINRVEMYAGCIKNSEDLIMRILEEEIMIKIAGSTYRSSGSDSAF